MHDFTSHIRWTGNRGDGNARYEGYDRRWQLCSPGKPVLDCSNDPLLGGDPLLYNPEDLLITALSSCHMLWFLHLSFNAGIVVMGYEDHPILERSNKGADVMATEVKRLKIHKLRLKDDAARVRKAMRFAVYFCTHDQCNALCIHWTT